MAIQSWQVEFEGLHTGLSACSGISGKSYVTGCTVDQSEDYIRIEIRHACESVARRVRAWFERTAEGKRLGVLDGSRSVLLPHPDQGGALIKIKGAGLLGQGIRFGRYLNSGPMAVTFDFDGRMMEDIASGHDNAVLGGASFQQASTEYLVSRQLSSEGYAVVPCLGFGSVETAAGKSWFTVFEWNKSWSGIAISPGESPDAYFEANIALARQQLEVALRSDLIGYFGYLRDAAGNYIIKDLHPFRRLDPVNHSQLSWTLEFLQALWVRCSACRFFAKAARVELGEDDLAAIPLRAVIADANAADYRLFETMIVRPYLHSRPNAAFSSAQLHAALEKVRVAKALFALCPQKYTRFRP